MMKKRENIIIAVLTILISVMDLTGIPSVFFINIRIIDIDPMYFTLMVNFLLIGALAYFIMKNFCPEWELGFKKDGLIFGLKKYGFIGVVVAVIGFIAYYVGLRPFDLHPSLPKVLIEGVIYYVGLAIIEELYVRGLLLNLIERIFSKNKNSTLIAIVLSSIIFGLGHIFGVLNQTLLVIVIKVVWTVGMGMFFGMIYKNTGNLWVPIIIHYIINVCALPYCFSSRNGYANLTLYIVLPTYLLLGGYSLISIKRKTKSIKPMLP